LFANDILKVLYAPHKAFKEITQNPKYLGVIVVFILFIAVQTGFYYSLYGNTRYEQTSPASTALGSWTQNSTLWLTSSGVTISNNYVDFMNNTFYGNSSLQFSSSGSNNMSIALGNFDSVKCGPESFQNLSMRIKIVDPQTTPTHVTLTLYSISDANYFQYDLTSSFSSSSTDIWNNITIPVGSAAANWQSTGDAKWENITSIKLDFSFSTASNIILRVEGLFFRGLYQTPVQTYGDTTFLITVLQQVLLQFAFEWLLFTGLMYIIIKGLKGNVIWKPIFIAVGLALIVLVVQSLIGIAATTTLPTIYYPAEFLTGLSGEAQVLSNSIMSITSTYTTIAAIISILTYAWLAALGAFIVRALQPEFSWPKCILTGTAGILVTIILMALLGV
jgi:hypothetical protein